VLSRLLAHASRYQTKPGWLRRMTAKLGAVQLEATDTAGEPNRQL